MRSPNLKKFALILWALLSVAAVASKGYGFTCPQILDALSASQEKNFENGSPYLMDVRLQKEIALSETAVYYQKLKTQSRGIKTVYEFLKDIRNDKKPGFLFGLSTPRDAYAALGKTTGLMTWVEAYKKFNLSIKDPQHTEKFMQLISSQGGNLYFLVPRQLFSFPFDNSEKTGIRRLFGLPTIGPKKRGILQKEFSWLLAKGHEEALKKTTFIYGAYEFIGADFYDALKNDVPETRARVNFLSRLFQNFELYVPPQSLAPQTVDPSQWRGLWQ